MLEEDEGSGGVKEWVSEIKRSRIGIVWDDEDADVAAIVDESVGQ